VQIGEGCRQVGVADRWRGADRHADGWGGRQACRQVERLTDEEADRCADRCANRCAFVRVNGSE